MTSSGNLTFDANGDLTIKVGKGQREFLVCPKTLARASPVFKAMLYGDFKEARPANPTESWIIELPEDDADSTGILFNIIHSCFDRIPDILSLHQLFALLIVTEKYNMTQFVRPWINNWFAPHRISVSLDNYALMLSITWELGEEAIFTDVAKAICIEWGINSSGNLAIEYSYP